MVNRAICFIVIAALSIGLPILNLGCTVNLVVPESGDAGTASGTDSTTTGNDAGTTTEESNPNSPCADKTNVYVSYVNQSSAQITFVESLRDESDRIVSAKMMLLQPVGDADANWDKCIDCPWKMGIKNLSFIEGGHTTKPSLPADLTRANFKCGDHVTFVFKTDYSVSATVVTP